MVELIINVDLMTKVADLTPYIKLCFKKSNQKHISIGWK